MCANAPIKPLRYRQPITSQMVKLPLSSLVNGSIIKMKAILNRLVMTKTDFLPHFLMQKGARSMPHSEELP